MSKLLVLTFTLLSFFSIQTTAFACAFCGDKVSHEEKTTINFENNQPIFESIQNEATVVIAFHSKSCSSCKIQKPELESILKDASYTSSKNYFMNFESSPELRKKLNVKFPSTVIVFKSGKEISRVTGETDRAKLTSLIKKGF